MTLRQWYAAWAAALDELELDVVTTEGLLADEHMTREHPLTDRWHPPQGLGPLPLELRPRADAVLARQLAAAAAVGQAMVANRQRAALLERLDGPQRPPRRPAYVDCAM